MQQVPDVELRFAELQTQIERLSTSLHRWQQAQERGHPAEERLGQLIARLEARLGDWSFVESRLEQERDRRVRQFEQIIEQEGAAVRHLHAEPLKQLREQAANLEETCIAAANLSLRGFERAEARLGALEDELHVRLTQVSRELKAAVAERRAALPAAVPPPPDDSPPPETVTAVDDDVRRSDEDRRKDFSMVSPDWAADGASPAPGNSPTPDQVASLSDRIQSLERALTSFEAEVRPSAAPTEDLRRVWWIASTVTGLVLLAAVVFVILQQRRLDARVGDAAARVAAAERRADDAAARASQEIATARNDAEQRVAKAGGSRIVSDVLSAPDLVRYSLAGTSVAARAAGQLLWSPSRGMVFSVVRLPVPPKGTTYQLWLMTSTGAINGGLFVPDSAGRATLTADDLSAPPRPVGRVVVTLEPAGGSAVPTGAPFLNRVQ